MSRSGRAAAATSSTPPPPTLPPPLATLLPAAETDAQQQLVALEGNKAAAVDSPSLTPRTAPTALPGGRRDCPAGEADDDEDASLSSCKRPRLGEASPEAASDSVAPPPAEPDSVAPPPAPEPAPEPAEAEPAAPPPPALIWSCALHLLDADDLALQSQLELTEGHPALVGRAAYADLSVDSSRFPVTVSREHARLVCDDDEEGGESASGAPPPGPPQWYVEDLGSANGTTLNGEPVAKGQRSVALVDGDILCFGKDFGTNASEVRYQFRCSCSESVPEGQEPSTSAGVADTCKQDSGVLDDDDDAVWHRMTDE